MQTFYVRPTLKASKRTKERIRRHGPTFLQVDTSRPVCFGGVMCDRLVSMSTEWDGWIPVSEINMDATEPVTA